MERDIFQAIAAPTRWAVIASIALQAMTPNAIAEHFDTTRQVVSKHLRILTGCEPIKQEDEVTKRKNREPSWQRLGKHTIMKNNNPNTSAPSPFVQTYLHGTKSDLKIGDLIEAGFNSNYGQRKNAKYIFLTATLDAAVWGAELAAGEGRERIYLVEPTGEIENDPDLTDKKFPGNEYKDFLTKFQIEHKDEYLFEWIK